VEIRAEMVVVGVPTVRGTVAKGWGDVVDITIKKPREARFFFFGQCHGQYSSAHRI